MGFQGQLASVNLTDIFQTLTMNRQTGTLVVTEPQRFLHVYFEGGQVSRCTAPVIGDTPFLLHSLLRRGLLAQEQVDDLITRLRDTQHPLRELVLQSGYVAQNDLDEVLAWCIEEMVCPLFEDHVGEFAFHDGSPTPELLSPDSLAMGDIKLQTTQLVLEATRREDEWKRIREVIPDFTAMYVIDNDGRANLRNVESDAEMLKVLRFLDGRHTVDQISSDVGVARFDTYAIVAQLILAGVARARAPQEMVDDALALRLQGEREKARDLLEAILTQTPNVPEVLRPLAELCVELKDAPRAVELYLELIQSAQDAGALDQALIDLDLVIKLSPNDPDLHFDRAQILADLGREQDAANAYVAAANAYLTTKDVAQAIDACHRAKNLWPRAPEPHRYLARAYLMEGKPDSALIEYKSLWHALLSTMTPRKALDELRKTLDAECRFAAVKEQVLTHAQGSEAVKTASAARLLIYAMLVIVLAVGGVVGWKYAKEGVFKQRAEEKLLVLSAGVDQRLAKLEHDEVITEITKLVQDLASYPDLLKQLESLRGRVTNDLDQRLTAMLATAAEALTGGDLGRGEKLYTEVKTRAANAAPDIRAQADRGLIEVHRLGVDREVRPQVEEAERLWASESWEKSRDLLKSVVERDGLPPAVRDPYKAKLDQCLAALGSAEEMYRRGERLRQRRDKAAAVDVFRAAVKAEGDVWRERARASLYELESQLADELGRVISELVTAGAEQDAFAQLDQLRSLAREASNDEVKKYLDGFVLPFNLKLDHQLVTLSIVNGKDRTEVQAPPGTTGEWTHVLHYPVSGKLMVDARRPGYRAQTLTISADARKAGLALVLKRGHTWRAELGAEIGAAPTIGSGQLVVATHKPSLEIIEVSSGIARSVAFANNLDRFAATPLVDGNRAFAVLDDRLVCIDIPTRLMQWQYPDQKQPVLLDLNPASLVVQPNPDVLGQTQIFAGSVRGKIHTLKWDGLEVVADPVTQLDSQITGSPLVDQFQAWTTLYMPTTNGLDARNPSDMDPQNGIKQRWFFASHGEIIGRPARIELKGRPAILISDATGMVLALDADPRVGENDRKLGAWPVDGGITAAATVHVPSRTAYVASGGGRDGIVVALDLDQPGHQRWRFPVQGAIGAIVGAPAVGKRGIYVGDQNGRLYCLDPATGVERWQVDLQAAITGGILAHEGKVFVPAAGGSLSCFDEGEE